MSSSQFEQKLIKQIEPVLAPASPGVQVQVHQGGRKICDISVGETYPYYDLASLTKIIFTTQLMMKAFDEGRWNLETKVKDILSWFPYSALLIKDLLTHFSGLTWWFPIYKKLDLNASRVDRWTESARIIRDLQLENEHKDESVYSDIGFILLGHILEGLYSLPLLDLWTRTKETFYPGTSLEFHENNQPKAKVQYYAPTERCLWRGRTLQGEVHDENAWSFGGISSHAGLFGSVDDVSWFGFFVRSQLRGISKTAIRQKTAQVFASRARPSGKGDWALGYMMPTPGSASCGIYFSPYSIGHTGFTGTSIWYDPSIDLIVTILSNRVFLGRENKEFVKLRPQIHNWIIEGLRRT